ncbi:MAG: PucR family transcriptional regulator [Nocardioidaceae bacterium]
MTDDTSRGPTLPVAGVLGLDDPIVELLRARLPAVAERTVAAITVEVPSYANALTGSMGENIRSAVELALGGFLSLAARPRGSDPGTPLNPAREGAYALGRGEARSGRSMDALLAAYRIGARVSWRELSATAVEAGLSPDTLARFAELTFAYIDELSAASVADHTDELATTGRVRDRHLQRLGHNLLAGQPADQLAASAARADWDPPRTLTAVVLPGAHVRSTVALLDRRTLQPEEELPDVEGEDTSHLAVLLVPDAEGSARPALLQALRGHQAYVGPARPWTRVRDSYLRVLRARGLGLIGDGDVLDTEEHLPALVLTADPAALADLRARVLAPLDHVRADTAERLAETLHAWLLHLGRRDDVAAALHVHPQTVRYRMGQIRDLFGDSLSDPANVLALTVALATFDSRVESAPPVGPPDRSSRRAD